MLFNLTLVLFLGISLLFTVMNIDGTYSRYNRCSARVSRDRVS